MTASRNDEDDRELGTVEGPCYRCSSLIPAGEVSCPGCGYSRNFEQAHWRLLQQAGDRGSGVAWEDWRAKHVDEPLRLEAADLAGARLPASLMRSDLRGADLEGADLGFADLTGSLLWQAKLRGANLRGANLDAVDLSGADIRAVTASRALVSGATTLEGCVCDRHTDFSNVALGAARVEPGLRGVLERNVRQKAWEVWYRRDWLRYLTISLPVRVFWWISDYGHSTRRILLVFTFLSVLFAGVYYWSDLQSPGTLVRNLSRPDSHSTDAMAVSVEAHTRGASLPAMVVFWRALYFSTVTMTTLGFGDLSAAPYSGLGHVLLMLQVLSGYVLLGAFITRLAIMFQGTNAPYVPYQTRFF